MIHIDPSGLVGKGKRRECHVHPQDHNLCIKIVVAGDNKETLRENAYYGFLEKRNILWTNLPRYYGEVETNLGAGYVFELIRDYDDNISKTLEYYLSSSKETESNYHGLSQALPLLKEYLIQHRIMTMELRPKNIAYRKTSDSEGILILVDNIGNSDFIPICRYVQFLATNKINRKWRNFEQRLRRDYAHNPALQQILASSHC